MSVYLEGFGWIKIDATPGYSNEETLNDYKNRLAKFDEFDEKKDILKLIKWFEKVRYSDYLVSDEEVKWAEKIIKIKIK